MPGHQLPWAALWLTTALARLCRSAQSRVTLVGVVRRWCLSRSLLWASQSESAWMAGQPGIRQTRLRLRAISGHRFDCILPGR